MNELRPALRSYLWAVYLAVALLVLDAALRLAIFGAWQLAEVESSLVFWALTYLSERMTARLAGGHAHSMSTVTLIAAILVLPPPYPLLVALLVMLAADLPRPLPLYKRLYNVAHATLVTGCASLVFSRLAPPLPRWTPAHLVAHAPAFALLALVYAILDIGSVQVVLALATHEPITMSLRRTTFKTLIPEGVAIGLGLLAAVAWAYSPLILPLFLLPILTLRQAFRAIEQAEERAIALRAHNAQLETVIQTGQHLSLQQPRADLLRSLAAAALDVARASSVAVYLRDEHDVTALERVIVLPREAVTPSPDRLPVPLALPVALVQSPPDAAETLIVSLEADGALVGQLHLHGVAPGDDPGTVHALALLANQAAIAVQNAQLHERVLAQVSVDGLTGLPTHRAFHARLDEEIARSRRLGLWAPVCQVASVPG